ncbi:hypothetical protein DSL72_008374 [Monilinia vaccinii-corymbosi]|uniref:Uncharacterized protein n=1 Tax=Monilinia vaccinii-corymbosi TaxID=61207 RepID=A0A8A3PKL3_9HELO|nr:hypothetical protein DSL72_008374 [Monilinia vaccinii-corymbosi]
MASMEEKLLMGVLSQIEVGRIDYDPTATAMAMKRFSSQNHPMLAFTITDITRFTELAEFIGVATPKAARLQMGSLPTKPYKGVGSSAKHCEKGGWSGQESWQEWVWKPQEITRPGYQEGKCQGEEETGGKTEDEEEMDYDKESTGVDIKMEEPVTPSRKLPSRRARVTRFVEETSDAEDEQEGEDGYMHVTAGVEKMEHLAVKNENESDELLY